LARLQDVDVAYEAASALRYERQLMGELPFDDEGPQPERKRDVIYRTFKTPAQQSGGMDPATQAQWDAWVLGHIANALAEHRDLLIAAIGEALAEERKSMRAHVGAELGKLRAEVEVLRSILKSGNVTPMGDRDAA
jgi:hypothetical protein